jgi:hypothetical protein
MQEMRGKMPRIKKGRFESTPTQNKKQPSEKRAVETNAGKKPVVESRGSVAKTTTENLKANKPSVETDTRKKAAQTPSVASSSQKVAIENSKPQLKQNLPDKNKNQQEEASNKMKPKSSSEDKLARNKVSKLRAVSSSPPPADLENEIREKAYQIYLEDPSQSDPTANWLKAEAEVKAKYSK